MGFLPTTKLQRVFYVTGTLVLVVGSLYWARALLIPVATAILLTFVLAPAVLFLQRRGLSRWPAALATTAFSVAVVVAVAATFFSQVRRLGADIPAYKDQIIAKINSVRDATQSTGLDEVLAALRDISESVAGESDPDAKEIVVQTSLLPYLAAVADSALDFLVNAGLVLLLVLFMLVHREDMRNRLLRLLGADDITASTKLLDETGERVSRFLLMQVVVNGSYGIVLAVGLYFMGIPYAFTWGLLAALLRYVPYLGPWVAAVFPVLMSLAISPGWAPFVAVSVFIIVLELVSNNFIETIVYGQSIGVSDVALLIAAAFWTWVWGPLGLVLSTPLTACLAVFGRHVPQLECFHYLLGDQPALDEPTSFYQRLLARDDEEAADLIEDYAKEHGPERVFDKMFLPALAMLSHDQARRELRAGDESFMLQTIQQTLEDVVPPLHQDRGVDDTAESEGPAALVLAVSARDAADETALILLKAFLGPAPCDFQVLSPDVLPSECLVKIGAEKPDLVFIGSLARGKTARVRLLCKRIRRAFPDMKIVVGCWGAGDASEANRKRLEEAGADRTASTFAEARAQIQQCLRLSSAGAAAERQPERVGASPIE